MKVNTTNWPDICSVVSQQQQDDHRVAPDLGPCLEVDRRADQSTRQPPRQQQRS